MLRYLLVLPLFATQPIWAAELTLDQRLIVACYKLRPDDVVKCLRQGADVNARFGDYTEHDHLFHDRWTGGLASIGTELWTPLIALASAPRYPDAPAELGEIWEDPERAYALRQKAEARDWPRRQRSSLKILDILLSPGCALDLDDGHGATALYIAVSDRKLEMVKSLLAYGADPNTKTRVYIDGPDNLTPLHIARSSEMFELLLRHGANPRALDGDGRSPEDPSGRDYETLLRELAEP